MAIVHARVDERLIHGQVAMVWTNTVGASRIVVVNAAAVKDEMQIAALKIAKPAGVKLSILSPAKAVEKFKTDVYDQDKVFIITKNIEDMALLADNGIINKFNVGNIAKREGATSIKNSVALVQKDVDTINRLLDNGVTITAQMVPTESDQSIAEYLK